MKNRFKIFSTLLIASFLMLGSCTDKFEEMNTDKRGVTDEQLQADFYFVGGFFPQMQQMIYCNFNWGWGVNWPYQIMQNLSSDIFSGYMMTPTPFAGNVNNTTYALVDGWNGSNWDYTYAYFMTVANKVEKLTKVDYPSFYATAKILKVAAMHRVSDQYGPIIYTHYGDSKTGGQFDSQEEAYNAFFADLDEAVILLDAYIKANPDAKPFENYDQMFGGDYAEWIRFANSLRLRLAMRISDASPAKAEVEAESAISNSYGLLTVDATVSGKGYTNPLAAISSAWGDIRMGAPIESILSGYNDPRLEKFFTETTDEKLIEAGYKFKGIRQGIRLVDKAEYVNHSGINLTQESPAILMSVAETHFLKSEGALNGWDMGGSAKSFYESGIQMSMNQWGASMGDYLTSSNVAAPFTDIYRGDTNDVAAGSKYLTTVSPSWDEAVSEEEQREKIAVQKWIAIFPEGMEGWAEARRTGYPKLFPVVINLSGGKIDTEKMVRRLNFSVTEKEANPEGYAKAVEYLGGEDTGGTNLWWDVN